MIVHVDTFARAGLTFDLTDTGPGGGRAVILLHGFPEDRGCWDGIVPALAAAGHRVLAPDQRGYSLGASPAGRGAYALRELEADVLALADAAGAQRFDVVGHDWGAAVAWALAAHHPERVRSLTALSVPHTQAFLRAMVRGTQLLHSWYMVAFQIPVLPEALLTRDGGRLLARLLSRAGLDAETAARYGARAARSGLAGPLGWYRAIPLSARRPLAAVTVPTLFVYGDGDPAITAAAARGCADFVRGPYRYVELAGAGHWLPSDRPEEVSRLVLAHLDGT